MHTLASIDVLDLDNPAAPAAYSVDGVDAKAATTNKPRHHDLTHRIFIHCCARQGACGFDWTSFSFALRGARARVTILGRRCDRLVTVAEFASRKWDLFTVLTLSAKSARDESKQGKWPSTVRLHLSSVVGANILCRPSSARIDFDSHIKIATLDRRIKLESAAAQMRQLQTAHVSSIASTPGDRYKPERSIAKSHRAGSALVIKSR